MTKLKKTLLWQTFYVVPIIVALGVVAKIHWAIVAAVALASVAPWAMRLRQAPKNESKPNRRQPSCAGLLPGFSTLVFPVARVYADRTSHGETGR